MQQGFFMASIINNIFSWWSFSFSCCRIIFAFFSSWSCEINMFKILVPWNTIEKYHYLHLKRLWNHPHFVSTILKPILDLLTTHVQLSSKFIFLFRIRMRALFEEAAHKSYNSTSKIKNNCVCMCVVVSFGCLRFKMFDLIWIMSAIFPSLIITTQWII